MLLADEVTIPKYSNIPGLEDSKISQWQNLGDIISRFLVYLFPLAGLAAFAYLLYGGFQLMVAQGDENGIKEAKAKITNALIGFLIIFLAYWLVQAVGIIFGVKLL